MSHDELVHALSTTLQSLVDRVERTGGYSTYEEQIVLFRAKALLKEMGVSDFSNEGERSNGESQTARKEPFDE